MFAASVTGNVAAITLGALLVVAGTAKIAAGAAWPVQAARLGTPRPIAMAVPWIEITLGASTAAHVVHPWPAVAALALLVAFTVLLGVRLAEGHHPPCACFGAWSTTTLSWRHIGRNVVMMVIAVVAIAA